MVKALQSLPTRPIEVIERILDSLKSLGKGSAVIAERVFTWIYYARRPLRMDELRHAVSIEEEDNSLQQDIITDRSAVNILRCCQGLVRHNKVTGFVECIHHTVRDYLAKYVLPELYVARVCLTYLNFSRFKQKFVLTNGEVVTQKFVILNSDTVSIDIPITEEYALALYAGEHWMSHCKGCSEDDPTVQKLFLSIMASSNNRVWLRQLQRRAETRHWSVYTQDEPVFHIIAKAGLASLGKLCLRVFREAEIAEPPPHQSYHLDGVSYNGRPKSAYPMFLSGMELELTARDELLQTALHVAAAHGYGTMMELILAEPAGAYMVNWQNVEGSTALHFATGAEIAQKLLLKGTNALTRNRWGQTALHVAGKLGNEELVKVLLMADSSTIQDRDGDTPLHVAVSRDQAAVVQLLLENGLEAAIPNSDGSTALHLAARAGKEASVRLLLPKHQDLESVDKRGRTPVHLATAAGHDAILKLLMESGADMTKADQDGKTPIHLAVENGRLQTLKLIIETGDVRKPDRSDQTSLHLAVQCGSNAIVEMLLEAGANPWCRDRLGQTPLHLAALHGFVDLLRTLLEASEPAIRTSQRVSAGL